MITVVWDWSLLTVVYHHLYVGEWSIIERWHRIKAFMVWLCLFIDDWCKPHIMEEWNRIITAVIWSAVEVNRTQRVSQVSKVLGDVLGSLMLCSLRYMLWSTIIRYILCCVGQCGATLAPGGHTQVQVGLCDPGSRLVQLVWVSKFLGAKAALIEANQTLDLSS